MIANDFVREITSNLIDIDLVLGDIEAMAEKVMAEKVMVMVTDMNRTYFGYNVEETGEKWRIAPPCYVEAGIKNNIVQDYAFTLTDKIKELREAVNESMERGEAI